MLVESFLRISGRPIETKAAVPSAVNLRFLGSLILSN